MPTRIKDENTELFHAPTGGWLPVISLAEAQQGMSVRLIDAQKQLIDQTINQLAGIRGELATKQQMDGLGLQINAVISQLNECLSLLGELSNISDITTVINTKIDTVVSQLQGLSALFPPALGVRSPESSLSVVQAGYQRTPSFSVTTTSGTIPAGTSSVSITNIGANDGLVLSTTLPAGIGLTWSANGRDTISAISYNATNTQFLIVTLT